MLIARSLLLMLCAAAPALPADDGAGGAGGNGGAGSVIVPATQAERDQLWSALAEDQRALVRTAAKRAAEADPGMDEATATGWILTELIRQGPGQRAALLQDIADELDQPAPRSNDPEQLTQEDLARGKAVEAAAAGPIAQLERGDPDQAELAWRALLAIGPDARAPLLARARQLPPAGAAAVRLRLVADDLFLQFGRRRLLAAIAAAQGALAAQPDALRARAFWLIARAVCDDGSRDPAHDLCYWSFPEQRRSYQAPVSLEYGNGANALGVSMYGGQDNQIIDLGTRTRLPASWPEALAEHGGLAGEQQARAVVGHRYAERLHEDHHADGYVVFAVLAKGADWCVIAPVDLGSR